MRKVVSLLMVYFLLVGQCFAVTGVPDSGTWVQAGFAASGSFTTVVPDHFTPDLVYTSPDVNAPYVSTDKGENWNFLHKIAGVSSGYGIAQTGNFIQSKINANLMYTMEANVNTGGLYKSIDKGQTWTKMEDFKTPKPAKYIALSQVDEDVVYAASQGVRNLTEGGRVWASSDGGTTWAELFRPFDTAITAESAEINGSTATRTGALNNLNNILKGSVVFTSASGETFTDDGNGVLVSNMGGSGTIKYANIATTSGANKYGNYTLVFGSTPSTTTVSYTISYNAQFIFLNKAGTHLFVGRSASSGTTFVRYTIATNTLTPITLTGTNATYMIDFDEYVDGSNVEHFCVGAGLKIACTDDDGDNWTYTTNLPGGTTYKIDRLGVRLKADNSVNFVVNRSLISNPAISAFYHSEDGGTTWDQGGRSFNATMNPTAAASAGTPRVYSINDDPFEEGVWYMSDDWRTYRSDDDGDHFLEKDHGAQNTVNTDVAVAPNGRWFQTAMDAGIQYSDDKGVTWIQGTPSIAKGQPFVSASPNDYGGHYWRVITLGTKEEWDAGNGIVLATVTMYSNYPALNFRQYVVKSVNGGITWTRSNEGIPDDYLDGDTVWDKGYMRAMDKSINEDVIYVGTDGQSASGRGGCFKSTDMAETFERCWPGTPDKVFRGLKVDPTDSTGSTLLFGTFNGKPVGYNSYRLTSLTENAELTGTGLTRTGNTNKKGIVVQGSVVFTSSGETFTDTETTASTGTLTGSAGGFGTINYSTGAYSLTFASTPTTTTVSYKWKAYVNIAPDVYDFAYDSKGTPYAGSSNGGATLWKSVFTTYGDGSGQWGTWIAMKNFASTGIVKGLLVDPQNDNRIFVTVSEGALSVRRIYVTTQANLGTSAKWHDITGSFPVVGGCQALAIDYEDGEKGHLLCATNGAGLWKLPLDDSPQALPPGRTCIGACI